MTHPPKERPLRVCLRGLVERLVAAEGDGATAQELARRVAESAYRLGRRHAAESRRGHKVRR